MKKIKSTYSGKTVLITGHTGFKGSWLAAWLVNLGANVIGFAKDIPTETSNFQVSRIDTLIDSNFIIKHVIKDYKNNVRCVLANYK